MEMFEFTPLAANPVEALFAGVWYRVTVFNGFVCDFWLPRKATRREAREAAHEFIGPEFYDPEDIETVRKISVETMRKGTEQ